MNMEEQLTDDVQTDCVQKAQIYVTEKTYEIVNENRKTRCTEIRTTLWTDVS